MGLSPFLFNNNNLDAHIALYVSERDTCGRKTLYNADLVRSHYCYIALNLNARNWLP